MTSIRRIAFSGEQSARSNPLDVWGRRVAVAIAVLIALPILAAGTIALFS